MWKHAGRGPLPPRRQVIQQKKQGTVGEELLFMKTREVIIKLNLTLTSKQVNYLKRREVSQPINPESGIVWEDPLLIPPKVSLINAYLLPGSYL